MPTDAATSGVASDAALFVTFYVSRERASSLHEQLKDLIQTLDFMPILGQDSAYRPLVGTMVEPPAAHDAAAIRLVFNAPGDAAAAWEAMREQLRVVLKALDSSYDWWGYTLIYQAVLNGTGGMDLAFSKLLPAVRRVDSSKSLQALAQADLSGGRVWLVDIPQEGNGEAAATIYVALSPPVMEGAFKRVLLGPKLLMVDLIAHKGYFLKRQYRGGAQVEYREGLGAFWEITDELLADLNHRIRDSAKLDRLARTYSVLVGIVSMLNRISVSMVQQLHNYESWRKQIGNNDIVEYHYVHLEVAKQELELMVAQGKDALEIANTSMSMAQVELDRQLASKQGLIGDLLALGGAALAVPELINHDVAKAFLGVSAGEQFSVAAFLVQVIAIVVTAVFLVLLARVINWGRTWLRINSEGR